METVFFRSAYTTFIHDWDAKDMSKIDRKSIKTINKSGPRFEPCGIPDVEMNIWKQNHFY